MDSLGASKIIVRGLQRTDMSSFLELCKSRDGLDDETARARTAVVEHIAFNNPNDDGKPTYMVGVQDDRVVAHLGRMPTQFCIDGSLESGSYFHDLYVHPDIRASGGQGFFLSMKLYQAAEDASPGFVALVWTNEINIALQQARKYDQQWADRRIKVLALDDKINRVTPKFVAAIAKPACRGALRAVDSCRSIFNRGDVRLVQHFGNEFDRLAKKTLSTIGISPYKSAAYLNWKYTSRPNLHATILAASDKDGEMTGFAVLIDPDPMYRAATLAEFVVENNDQAVMCNLLDASVRYARSRGAQRISAVATNEAYATLFKSRLFLTRDVRDPLFIALADRSPNRALVVDICNWHMSRGDSEGPF